MDADQIIAGLRNRVRSHRGRYVDIAKASGLSVSWVSKFAIGVKDDPKLRTVAALDCALSEIDKDAA